MPMSMPLKASRLARTGTSVPSRPLPISSTATLIISAETDNIECFSADIEQHRFPNKKPHDVFGK